MFLGKIAAEGGSFFRSFFLISKTMVTQAAEMPLFRQGIGLVQKTFKNWDWKTCSVTAGAVVGSAYLYSRGWIIDKIASALLEANDESFDKLSDPLIKGLRDRTQQVMQKREIT